MDGWSATVLDECLQRQIDKKIFKLKIKACPVNTDHCMAFKHSIWFETYLAETLVVIDSESRLTSFPSSCALQSEVSVLFYLNLSRPIPRTGC